MLRGCPLYDYQVFTFDICVFLLLYYMNITVCPLRMEDLNAVYHIISVCVATFTGRHPLARRNS